MMLLFLQNLSFYRLHQLQFQYFPLYELLMQCQQREHFRSQRKKSFSFQDFFSSLEKVFPRVYHHSEKKNKKRIIIIYRMRRSGYDLHNFNHINTTM
jgi:hypothetical protein